MATVIFDFDSTIICCESLEIILEEKLEGNPLGREKIREITEMGMRGKIPFFESLSERLEIAAPTRDEVTAFGERAVDYLTEGMDDLVRHLHEWGADVWIISGGIVESILPLAEKLSIPREKVLGVELNWDENGAFIGIDTTVPLCRSKVEGAKHYAAHWHPPKIVVGDSVSDYRLFQMGLVENFIAFTQHFKCQEVLRFGVVEAKNTIELEERLQEIING